MKLDFFSCLTKSRRPYLIAEAGVNHNGDENLAIQMIEAAAAAGSDAVKFQAFTAERLAGTEAPLAAYQARNLKSQGSQQEMLKKLELPREAFRRIKRRCDDLHLEFLCTPFDEESADLLEDLAIKMYKISSADLTCHPFLAHLAKKGRPLILSTGMATMEEIRAAIDIIRGSGDPPLALLHCVTNYPANPEEVNLRCMQTMAREFHLPIGYSDHAEGIEISLAAGALGACLIEKHFTLDRNLPGPDHLASIEPDELRKLAAGLRSISAALGSEVKMPSLIEKQTSAVVRKSLVSRAFLARGTILVPEHLAWRRPGTGIPADSLPAVLGRKLKIDLPENHILSWDFLE